MCAFFFFFFFKQKTAYEIMPSLVGSEMCIRDRYQVLLDPGKVASVGLSVAQVESALTANNDDSGGGFYSQGGQFYYVRGMGRVNTLEDIGNVVVAVRNGTP